MNFLKKQLQLLKQYFSSTNIITIYNRIYLSGSIYIRLNLGFYS